MIAQQKHTLITDVLCIVHSSSLYTAFSVSQNADKQKAKCIVTAGPQHWSSPLKTLVLNFNTPPTGYLLTSQGFLVSTLMIFIEVSSSPEGERRWHTLATAHRSVDAEPRRPKGLVLLFDAGRDRGSASSCLKIRGERDESSLLLLSWWKTKEKWI